MLKTDHAMAPAIRHSIVPANGIELHVAECGEGPLVLLCHGWPELWYSWRHQLRALGAAGFRAVAPDMRGFGRSTAPEDMSAYTILHLTGDMVALVQALGETRAMIVGHDWGAPVAWHAALMRPDIFTAVAALSVPHRRRGLARPLETLKAAGKSDYYWIYFQEPGVAEAELERDARAAIRRILYIGSGDTPREHKMSFYVDRERGFLGAAAEPVALPAWLTEADLDAFASEYQRTGFRGGLNWYRNIDRNWELTAPWAGAAITQPALFIAGTHDAVITGSLGQRALDELISVVPNLTEKILIEGAGHWIQQERPNEVNAALIAFARAHSAI
jgi:pimeloyl-ACP methyl ester carboxylesterase